MERRGSERTAHLRMYALKGVDIFFAGKSAENVEPDSTQRLRPAR